jgi:glycosyltransferase involved in cell wall biosynthesis
MNRISSAAFFYYVIFNYDLLNSEKSQQTWSIKIRISVITVSYNSAKTISDTLDAVAMQTHADVEHLVIDGASKDGTVEIVYGHANPQIRLISEPDTGIYEAMNKGFSQATGEVVGFLNSDDFYVDDAVLTKVSNAFQDPTVDACYADLVYVTRENNRVVRFWKSKPFRKGDFAKGWCPAHPTFFVRKSVIERLGFFDQSYKLAADVEFMMRYLERWEIRAAYIPHVFVHMRLGGVTNKSTKNIMLQNKEIFAALRKNGVPFSKVWFATFKVVSRLWQFAVGRVRRDH